MAPLNVSTQYFETGNVTVKATAAIIGRRFLALSGTRTGGPGLSTDVENVYRAAHAGAGARAIGVSKYDVPINGLSGIHGQPGMIVQVTAGAALTAGQSVMSDANGQAVAWVSAAAEANVRCGVCMADQPTVGSPAEIKLHL